jgi:late competence protein required for DNA uptake (superfamily II DNA/RNA helicase)
VGTIQARRTQEGRCRECGDEITRSARKDGGRPVYCAACLTLRREKEAERVALHRKNNDEIRRQLAPFWPNTEE